MKIYVFGNQDEVSDKKAFEVMDALKDKLSEIEWVVVKPNEDLPFAGEDEVVLMDVVQGLKAPRLIEDEELNQIAIGPRMTAHDFDLGWQIKYLKKLGKLGRVRLVGLPMEEVNNQKVYEILKEVLRG
jgi:Ni,Fe-hydrogenase maturation factor